jgi:hypothetical protein
MEQEIPTLMGVHVVQAFVFTFTLMIVLLLGFFVPYVASVHSVFSNVYSAGCLSQIMEECWRDMFLCKK